MDSSVVIVARGGGIRGLNENGKNTIKKEKGIEILFWGCADDNIFKFQLLYIRIISYSTFVFKRYFPWYKILDCQLFFPFQYIKDVVILSFHLYCFQQEISCYPYLYFTIYIWLLLSFSVYHLFWTIYDTSSCSFFMYLVLRVCWVFGPVHLQFSFNLDIILSNIFLSTPLHSFRRSNYSLNFPVAHCSFIKLFFNSLFSLCLILGSICCYVIRFTNLLSNHLLITSIVVFISHAVLLIFKSLISSFLYKISPEDTQPCNVKNRNIYWRRRYKKHGTQDSDASVPLKAGTLGPHISSPSHHQLPRGISLNLFGCLKSLPFPR